MSTMPRRSNPLPLIVGAAGIVIFLGAIVAYAAGQGPAEGRAPAADDRRSPQTVNERVAEALRQNDTDRLYAELSPSLTELFSLQAMQAGEQSALDAEGAVTAVQVVERPRIRTEPGWDGKWADAQVRITRPGGTRTYLVRYVLEDGQWYLFGTVELP